MTEFKDKIEQTDKPSEIPVSQPDIPTTFDPTKMSENSATESKQFFDDIFKTLGLIPNTENQSARYGIIQALSHKTGDSACFLHYI